MAMTQDEYRRLSWDIYKWIRKNDPNLSLQINRELYSIAENIMVEYHIRMSLDNINPYDEIKSAIEKVADMENKYKLQKFELTNKLINDFLKFSNN